MRTIAGLQNQRGRAVDGLTSGRSDRYSPGSGVLEICVPHFIQLPAERSGCGECHCNRRGITETDELPAVALYCGVCRPGLRVDLRYDTVERPLVRGQNSLLEAVRA